MSRDARALSPQVFHILLSLSDEPRHGYALITDIRDRTGGGISLTASTLYDALARLLDAGLLREVEAPPADVDSRRRYYGITKPGRQTLADEIDRLERQLEMARAKNLAPAGRKRVR